MSSAVDHPAPPAVRARTGPAVLALALVPALVLAAVLSLFVWPALRLAPHGLEVAVVGPPAAAAAVGAELDRVRAGGFDVVAVPDASTARRAVRKGDVDGALVLGPQPRVLVAGAGGPAVAQVLSALGQHLPGATGPVPVDDVVPLPPADPRGAALPGGLLPVLVASVLLAGALSRRRAGTGLQLGAVAVGAGALGLTAAGLLHGWLDAMPGSCADTAWPVALAAAAVCLPALGLARLLGVPGLALAAVTTILVGNPLSGATSSPELLPRGWSAVGQLLPPGATAALLRRTTAFGGDGAGAPVAVLVSWAALGALLVVLAGRRRQGSVPAPAGTSPAGAAVLPYQVVGQP